VLRQAALLERDGELATLREAVADAAERRGSVVLVSGEAGIGKSSLIRTWAEDPGADARTLVGWCDDLLTRRTLGPLHDVARATGEPLRDAIARTDTSAVLDAMLAELDHPLRPTALVLEDVHWADEATLDVARYVGRRIERLPAVLVLTYREDELDDDHPLHAVLAACSGGRPPGAAASADRRAIATLTDGTDLDADEVARVTGGNPFFVTEVVRDGGRVPASVTDAVRARCRRSRPLAPAVELLSVVPGAADRALVRARVDPRLLGRRGARVLLGHRRRGAVPARAGPAGGPGLAAGRGPDRPPRGGPRALLELDRDDAAILHHASRPAVGTSSRPGAARRARGVPAGANREAASHQATSWPRGPARPRGARAAPRGAGVDAVQPAPLRRGGRTRPRSRSTSEGSGTRSPTAAR
jgi:hypothetical protein